MRILITGTPGTGKTQIAKLLARKLNATVINEMDFALSHKIGHWNHELGELEIPLGKMKKELGKELAKYNGKRKNVIVEGHTLCEVKLRIDQVIVLRVHPELLEQRLEQRGYQSEKLMDNVFCEGIEYCKKHAVRNYGKKKTAEVANEKGIKDTLTRIIAVLTEKGII